MSDLDKLTETFDEIGIHYVREDRGNWTIIWLVDSSNPKIENVNQKSKAYFEFEDGVFASQPDAGKIRRFP